MAHRLLRDAEADGWERSDFPIICESCLGDNPYVRMTKANFDKECKICTRPFTVFRWRPGRDARYKKTEVCQTCSKLKNVCQVCLLDLEYGLPVQVRDTALGLEGDSIPKSDVNREFYAEEQDRKAKAGQDFEGSYGRAARPNDLILKLQRTTPYYKRNRAHICSFFVRGECTRGAECPYRHEMPVEGPLAHQNLKDRFYGVNDPVAAKLLQKAGEMPSLAPPDDSSIATLYVGGMDPRVTEGDLHDAFYGYGEVNSIKMVPSKQCAFVTYTTREGAEKAAESLANKLVVKGLRLRLMWGKPQAPKPEALEGPRAGPSSAVHAGLLPRAVLPSQQAQQQLLPPPGDRSAGAGGAAAQSQPSEPPPPAEEPMDYFNMPPPPPAALSAPGAKEQAYYPSMDPEQLGAAAPGSRLSAEATDVGTSNSRVAQYHPPSMQPPSYHQGHQAPPPHPPYPPPHHPYTPHGVYPGEPPKHRPPPPPPGQYQAPPPPPGIPLRQMELPPQPAPPGQGMEVHSQQSQGYYYRPPPPPSAGGGEYGQQLGASEQGRRGFPSGPPPPPPPRGYQGYMPRPTHYNSGNY